MSYLTKPGKHGPLYLYRFTFRDRFDSTDRGVSRQWGYDEDHALERFADSFIADDFESHEILKIERVRQ